MAVMEDPFEITSLIPTMFSKHCSVMVPAVGMVVAQAIEAVPAMIPFGSLRPWSATTLNGDCDAPAFTEHNTGAKKLSWFSMPVLALIT